MISKEKILRKYDSMAKKIFGEGAFAVLANKDYMGMVAIHTGKFCVGECEVNEIEALSKVIKADKNGVIEIIATVNIFR
ncbi:MAG: hypothetical protein K2M45_08290 [Muribaculaceae bacterium]|nr:hypothetical protein [Muribaculaceae bacterium]